MIALFSSWVNWFNTRLEGIGDLKYWELKLALVLFLGFVAIYQPEALFKRLTNTWNPQELQTLNFINSKIKNPLTPYLKAKDSDHLRKRELRIVPYFIGHIFGVSGVVVFCLQALALLPFIYLLIVAVSAISPDIPTTFWATLSLLFCYIGQSFTHDTLFYDSFAYLFLLLAFYKRANWIWCAIALWLAYFVDERSLIASLAIPVYAFVETTYKPSSGENGKIWRDVRFRNSLLTVVGSMVVYIALRLLLKEQYNLITPVGTENGVGFGIALHYGAKVPLAIYSALKANSFLWLIGIGYCIHIKRYRLALILCSIGILYMIVALSVEDVTRSLAYSFLGIFVLHYLQAKTDSVLARRYTMMGTAFLNICSPTYALALELERIRSFQWPLY